MTPQDLKEARERAGLSLVQLAEYLGVSHRTVRRWEYGETPFKPRDQIAIEQVLRSLSTLGRNR